MLAKKGFKRGFVKAIKIFLKKKKTKNINIVINGKKIFEKMKNKS